jgi:hypothetical protein
MSQDYRKKAFQEMAKTLKGKSRTFKVVGSIFLAFMLSAFCYLLSHNEAGDNDYLVWSAVAIFGYVFSFSLAFESLIRILKENDKK